MPAGDESTRTREPGANDWAGYQRFVRYFAQDDAIQSPQATQIIERQLMGSADRAHPICPFRLPSSSG